MSENELRLRAEAAEAALRVQQQQVEDITAFKDHCLQQAADAKVLLHEETRLRKAAEAQLAALQEQITALVDVARSYGRHRASCKKGLCQKCQCSLISGHHEDSYNGDTSWHQFEWGQCSCGFDRKLAALVRPDHETPDPLTALRQQIRETAQRLRDYEAGKRNDPLTPEDLEKLL